MIKIIIEYKSMAQVNVAFAQSLGITITGRSKYAPIIFAIADENQITQLQNDPNVKRVSLDATVGTLQNFSEFDAPCPDSPGGVPQELYVQLAEAADIIKAKDAWAKGYTGKGIKIAILDTGVWEAHSWLQGKVIARWSAYGDNPATPINPHGTHVAGIVSAISPDAQIMNIKVLDDNGDGTFSAIMRGLEKAADLGADVINMSLGGVFDVCFDGHPLDTLITALSQKIIVVAAAGNSGPNPQTITFPGSARSVISVGNVDKTKTIAVCSSRGTSFCNEIRPDCAAIGVGVISSIPPNATAAITGTSMSAPMVSGMMAILRQKVFFSDKKTIENILRSSGNAEKNNDMGWGVIDISKALDVVTPAVPRQAGVGYLLLAGLGIALAWGWLHRKKI